MGTGQAGEQCNDIGATFSPGEPRVLWLGFCSSVPVMAICAACGWGVMLAPSAQERLRGAVVPCQVMQRHRAAVWVFLQGPSCSVGTAASLLPNHCLSCMCACPLYNKNIFFHSMVLKQKSTRAGCGCHCLPVAESEVTGSGIPCWMQ